MAKKKANKKNKKTADIKRILLLIFGSAAVISVLFIAGYLIDYAAIMFSKSPPKDRFSIIHENEKIDDPVKKKDETPAIKKDIYSPPETLSKKEGKKTEQDIKREEVIRNHTGTKPVKKTEPKPEVTSEKSNAPPTVYAVQLGSFKGFGAARSFRDEYISKGYKAYIVSAAVPGKGMLYRVRIGRFREIEDAQKFYVKLEKKEKISAFITSK